MEADLALPVVTKHNGRTGGRMKASRGRDRGTEGGREGGKKDGATIGDVLLGFVVRFGSS